ncbi:MerR family transcriptional regulator [Geodermatophilus sp. TF02-6]|uniref:MerR family transcriptional regulator n=1 Tax=Geodermatophilus sp. TF02-6 TaxID=2250575 RepID=UPI001314EFCE|nr:helix-turn-helix domain-containing protein [Geodermatophilus sp. TF02-6]
MTGSPHPRSLLIAEFARCCRLPVSTLRYYDRIGLLHPDSVDPATGYRRYAAGQLATAITIARLRGIGLAPEDIADVLAGSDRAARTLQAHRRRITAQIDERRHALARLDELAAPLAGRVDPPCVVDLVPGPVPALAFTSGVAELPATITRGVAVLRQRLRRAGVEPTGWGALLPLDPGEPISGHVFARTAGGTAQLTGPARSTATLPPGRGVQVTHRGDPDQLPLAYHAALTAIERRGAQPLALVIEDYLDPGAGDPGRPGIRITVPVRPGPDAAVGRERDPRGPSSGTGGVPSGRR